jgi:hypothetical protein
MEIKTHLRLEADETAEDALLTSLNEAAHDHAEKYIGRAIPWDDSEGVVVPLPASVRAAMLLIIGDLFENREAQIVGVSVEDNPTTWRLLHLYRVGLGI